MCLRCTAFDADRQRPCSRTSLDELIYLQTQAKALVRIIHRRALWLNKNYAIHAGQKLVTAVHAWRQTGGSVIVGNGVEGSARPVNKKPIALQKSTLIPTNTSFDQGRSSRLRIRHFQLLSTAGCLVGIRNAAYPAPPASYYMKTLHDLILLLFATCSSLVG